ncbi:hypothetical protein [Serratia quinivorans]|uniref:hypothetical protein n=1 Tax=Serratia quinivorans TaxID=137545 RepID=UPI0021BD0398|nr:hypothetical protein [Serratia quinivorans]
MKLAATAKKTKEATFAFIKKLSKRMEFIVISRVYVRTSDRWIFAILSAVAGVTLSASDIFCVALSNRENNVLCSPLAAISVRLVATRGYQMDANTPTDGGKNSHNRAVQQTIEDMNSVLAQSGLFISPLTEQDRRWQKGRKNGHTLNWRSLLKFYDSAVFKPGSFAFVFRWIAAPLTRAGFCLCYYHRVDNVIELVALERFTGYAAKHPLSGNMLQHCLHALYFYGVNLRGQDLISAALPNILISNVLNNHLLELYTRQASFTVIPGTMNCTTDFISLRKYLRRFKKIQR